MATTTAFIRTSKKSKEVNVRFRLRDGRTVDLYHVSEFLINSDLWDDKKQAIKAKMLYNETKRTEFNNSINGRKSLIADIYSKNVGVEGLTSEWLEAEIDKRLHPEKYGINEKQQTFFETFEEFLEKRKLSQVRKNNFRVIIRALKRFELYKTIIGSKVFELTLNSVSTETLHEIEKFLRNEHTFFSEYPEIYEKVPETRTPQPRGQNTINDIFTKIRTFFLWSIDRELTNNNPFKTFSIEECVYGTPIYISIEERNKLYTTNLKRHPKLAIQRDIFVFQCVIGCRVGDLYKMTKSNIIDDAIEYVAGKTKDNRPKTIRVPLNQIAKDILDRYKDYGGKLFPFISEQNIMWLLKLYS
ncbi:integrase [Dysgonomonas hofstadii]|uniref:Integrase n=1 Tax=Dysgonomonas hofstadii TaxID=637886 RepID=A0A840D064_9BACT|nr:phage integrase SAM-like domain-containing protein [Dysgonomonas hofstadii]MBB4037663.1 integrase [Dysgonomonas hofstadii]